MTNPTADQIAGLLAYFSPYCRDKSTLQKLQFVASRPAKWKTSYAVFERVRNKTLKATDRGDIRLQHQYCFEEICAKTLYNMSVCPEKHALVYPAPFDDDSIDYVMPLANDFADHLGIARPNQGEMRPPPHEAREFAITKCCTGAGLACVWNWMRSRFRPREH